jgi:hypothetical protein
MTPTQQLNIVGIVEDGKNPAPGLPSNPRTAIRVIAGQDTHVYMQAFYRSGPPVDLTPSGYVTTLSIRKKITDAVPAINPPTVGTLDPANRNACTFLLPHAAFRLPFFNGPGLWLYDIWLTIPGSPAQRVCLMPLSPLILEPTASNIPSP